ncbi:MAG: dihydroorotate dehydrogenase electron transfer subunit [Candidatus Zixiibacteriota bacterium]
MSKYSSERVPVSRVRHLSPNYHSLKLGPWSRINECRPGQFVHLGLPDSEIYFRRAMSIAAVDTGSGQIEIIFKVFGRGTRILSGYHKGDVVDVLGPLGVPFTPPRQNETCLFVAGGVGFPPLFYLASRLVARGRDPETIEFFYGGRTSGEVVERQRIRQLGVRFHPVTDDGSFGSKGLVTEAVEKYLDGHPVKRPRMYACGPDGMLKAADDLARKLGIPGEVSLEAPMPCGFGVCLGCVVPLRAGGHARVCKEGPVFQIGEVLL